jgi:hypothetical protein
LLFGALIYETAHAGRSARILSCQVFADLLPRSPAIGRLEQHVRRIVQNVRVDRREHQRLSPIGAVLRAAQWNWRDVLHFSSRPVKFGNLGSPATINQIRVERIRRDIPLLDHTHRMPIAKRNRTIIPPACDTHGAALLLPCANTVGE